MVTDVNFNRKLRTFWEFGPRLERDLPLMFIGKYIVVETRMIIVLTGSVNSQLNPAGIQSVSQV